MKKVVITAGAGAKIDHFDRRGTAGDTIIIAEGDELVVSDTYHTMDELYDHRITLYIALCRIRVMDVWRSHLHADGSMFPGEFILGIFTDMGKQITYHIPIERWAETDFAQEIDNAPEFDGHTPEDVLERLKSL